MSIQTELTRLTNAKAAIQAAIEGKGVTVPSGTLLDGMASLIEAIEAGGGAQIAYGTFTPTEDTYNYTVNHNLGVIPDYIAVWSSDASTPRTSKGVLAIGTIAKLNGYGQWHLRYRDSYYYYFAKSYTIGDNYSKLPFFNVNETKFEVFDDSLMNYASAGVTYAWITVKGIESW